jgi:pyruvate formate lyase activating enzyme
MSMTALLERLTTPAPGTPAALRCNLCAHRCTIAPGEAGFCGAIQHTGEGLRSLVSGRPVLMHADPIERKPLYHVRPGVRLLSLGTAGCTLRCAFCQNWRLSQSAPVQHPAPPPVRPEAVIVAAQEQGCAGIAFTYNEPTVWLDYVAEVMREAKRAGLLTVLNTNGYLTPEAIAALDSDNLLDAVNVDLKGFRDAWYREVCQGNLPPVCDAITHLHHRRVWVEVTTPLIPGHNDSDGELTRLAEFLARLSVDIPWHVWRFHPDYRMQSQAWTHPHDLERAVAIGRGAGLRYVYSSNTPGSPHQHTICPHCNEVLIARHGVTITEIRLHNGVCGACGQAIAGAF